MSQQSVQAPSIPTEALQLGETYHLGSPMASFKAQYSRNDAAFFISQLVILLLVLIVLSVVVVADLLYHAHNVTWLLLVLIFINSFNVLNINRRRKRPNVVTSPFERNRRFYVYQHGFISIRNKRPVVVRWEQVRRVQYIRPDPLRGRIASVSVVYQDNQGEKVTKRVGVGISNGYTNEDLDALGTLLEQQAKSYL